MKKKRIKQVMIGIAALLAALVMAVGGYMIYVFAAYYRIEDRQELEISGGTGQRASVGEPISLLSWNIGFGAYSADFSFFMDGGRYSRAFSKEAVLENLTQVCKTLQQSAPDLLLLQEVDQKATRSYQVDEMALLGESLQGYGRFSALNYDSPYLFYPLHCPHGKSRAGMMTFSRYDIGSALRRSLPVETSFMKFLDLDRCYTVARIPTESGRELILYNLHLSAYTSDGTIADEQLSLLLSDMKTEWEKGNYVVAGGDFNKDLLGDSSSIFGVDGGNYTWAQPISEGVIPNGFTLYAPSNAPSCRNADRPYNGEGSNFVLTVDGFIVSENVTVQRCETLDQEFAASDHNPVLLLLTLNK